MFEEIKLTGWEAAGFNIKIKNGEVTAFSFFEQFKEVLHVETFHGDKT